ncbi:DUF1028 domain-containing protein [Nodosilinea sp. LEGE 07298]|uniref:DUF1028 domain-containing protein n=1 Tax=Nodosilinea sp. LEGE 07298 TaxID=2777970 RepID=UPI0018807D10|nr:DUF1028 domain-containing protein [Nodosilinea sp. LEGE 07298]MBE9108934.1 DUF1028 domain-containing protein [Nodosilinea sp. LEGE 07298]
MTFSIVAWDPQTGMTGVAVATKHLAVGALVPHARAGVGAIATQAQTNPLLGIWGLELLERRQATESPFSEASAEVVLEWLLENDCDRDQRQVHLVDHTGHTAAWTGCDCTGWAGHRTFTNLSVAGNMLVGPEVLEAMAEAFHHGEGGDLSDRLLLALEAGDAAGGDKRGRQSAALYVMHHTPYPHLDLRVDHHHDPIAMLRSLYTEAHQDYYQSFRQSMPSYLAVRQQDKAVGLPKAV